MKTGLAEQTSTENAITEIVKYLSQDPLCLELRHYPASPELAGSETLHLLVIMQREVTQAERRRHLENLNAIASRHGMRVDVIFSSPSVWRDLRTLISPFTRIERESTIDWQRPATNSA